MAYRRSLSIRSKLLVNQNITPCFHYLLHHQQEENKNGKTENADSYNHYHSLHNNYYNRGVVVRGGGGCYLGKTAPYGLLFGARYLSTTTIGDDNFVSDAVIDTSISNVVVDAASSAAAPAVSEVAVAAADSYFPVAALQYLIDGIHHYTGLPWWGSIAVTTVIIRSLAVPLMINQLKATAKLALMRPRLEEIKQEMTDKGMSPTAVADGQKRMSKIFKEYGVTPWTPLKGILIQGPVFVSFFLAIQNMVDKVPSFKEGGAFWFTDLTTPDSFYILPVLTALSFWITVESNMQEGLEGNPMGGTMKNVSRGFAVLTVPITLSFPKAIFCYWITSNLFSLVYGLVLKAPGVKKFLGVPIIPVTKSSSAQTPFSFSEAIKKYVQSQQLPAPSPVAPSKPVLLTHTSKPSTKKIPSASVLSQRIRTLEKEVKGRKKGKKGR